MQRPHEAIAPAGMPLETRTTADYMAIPTETCELAPPVGLGVITTGWVAEGAIVAVFGGTPMPASIFFRLAPTTRSRSLQIGDDTFLVPGDTTSPASLINHSCEPNCRLGGEITVLAARDLAPGEILSYDYATSDSTPYDEFDCHCGSVLCRGQVTGSDWRRPDLHGRYAGWFSPYLQRRIDALSGTDFDADPSGGLARV